MIKGLAHSFPVLMYLITHPYRNMYIIFGKVKIKKFVWAPIGGDKYYK